MAVKTLTKRLVEAETYQGRTRLIRDTRVRGLMLAVNKTSKVYKIQRDMWRDGQCTTVRRTLGSTEELTLEQARALAEEATAQMRRGTNPWAVPDSASDGPAEWTLSELWDRYAQWMTTQERSERSLRDFRHHLDRFLSDWREVSIRDLTKSRARARHELITKGFDASSDPAGAPYTANKVMRSLRAAWNWAVRLDDHDALPPNPVGGVHFNPERRREAMILPEDLPDWWRRVGGLPNPLRRHMHRLGLLSGLRPGTLVSIKREWIDLSSRAIHIPRMKSGRAFSLPLSAPMVDLVECAMAAGDVLHVGSPWLFPTRTNDGQRIVGTRVWRERSMPGETGHILRHTWRTMADRLGVPQARARALLDQSQPGIEAHYLHLGQLRDELLAEQERISAHILRASGVNP